MGQLAAQLNLGGGGASEYTERVHGVSDEASNLHPIL